MPLLGCDGFGVVSSATRQDGVMGTSWFEVTSAKDQAALLDSDQNEMLSDVVGNYA